MKRSYAKRFLMSYNNGCWVHIPCSDHAERTNVRIAAYQWAKRNTKAVETKRAGGLISVRMTNIKTTPVKEPS